MLLAEKLVEIDSHGVKAKELVPTYASRLSTLAVQTKRASMCIFRGHWSGQCEKRLR